MRLPILIFLSSLLASAQLFPPISGGGGGSGTPASPTTSIQFNNAGSFGGSASLTWDGTTVTIGAITLNGTSGDITTSGAVIAGSGSGVAGLLSAAQGTAPSIPSNAFGFVAPTTITTSQFLQPPNAVSVAHSLMVIGAPSGNKSTFAYKAVPDCTDTGGNHLNFTQSTDVFSCGTSGGGGGSPGGSDRQFQVNNAAAFGGLFSMTYTGTFGAASEGVKFYNSTVTTGATTVLVKEGAGQVGAPFRVEGPTTTNDYVTINSGSGGGGMSMGSNSVGQTFAIGGGVPGANMGANAYISFQSVNRIDSGSQDTTINRAAAGILGVYSAGAGTTAANYRAVKASAVLSGGTTFTASGCSNGTLVGGATAGTLALGAGGACDVTITMGNSATAPTGWTCSASDRTTQAALISQKSSTTTTCVLTMPVTAQSGDVISFSAVGY